MRSNTARRTRIGRRALPAWILAVAVGTLGVRDRAAASGLDSGPSGAVGVGRAADDVRVRDYLAIWKNPANLSLLAGDDLGGDLRLPFYQRCFDRAKDSSREYFVSEPGGAVNGLESFASVCNDAGLMPTGNLGFARGFDSGWGWGVGFFTPSLIANQAYGNDTIISRYTLDGEVYPVTHTGTPSGSRYMLLERHALGGFVMAGLGANPTRALRFGLSAGFGFANLQNVNVASVQGGTFVDQELLIDLDVTDWLIPRMTSSLVVEPIDGLEFMGAITYQDDIRAEGHLDVTANGIRGAPLKNCRDAAPGPHCRIDDVQLTVPWQPLELTLGVRYAQRRSSADRRARDPLRDEVWDVEINGRFAQTSHVDRYAATLFREEPGQGSPRVAFSSAPTAAAVFLPQHAAIERHWKDTFGVRLGGDYNVLPSRLALRLGVSYEGRAVPAEYMHIDAAPLNQLGLHVGGTLALGRYRFTLGYAHVFFQEVDVGVGAGKVNEIVSVDPNKAQAVNEGHYRTALDIVSVQANVAF